MVSRPQNEALKSGRAETLRANRQNVGKVSPDISSLPFIRNHDFARNSTKGFIFKAFRVFSSRLHGRLKKETVNLSLKNANLCLGFALVHFILTNHFAAKAFSLTTVTRFLRSEVVWAPRAQTIFVQLIGWDFGAHPINYHPHPMAEERIQP